MVPTMEHARAAAGVLVEEGASLVLVHGSVPEGRARPGSDVDLVAVFDDIDYGERYPRRWRLEARCRAAAAGVPVEVHVTDWPEWKRRTGRVRSSFEAAVARRQVTLFERAPTAAQWGKEIEMPDSDLNEAVERLADVTQALNGMTDSCRLSDGEIAILDGREVVNESVRHRRLRRLRADASMVIENSLKVLSAVNGAESYRTHSIADLADTAGPMPDGLAAALEPLRGNTMRPSREEWDDISSWRIGGTYPSALPQATQERTQDLARALVRASVTAAEAALDSAQAAGASPDSDRMTECRWRLSRARSALEAGDVVEGVTLAQQGTERHTPRRARLGW